MGLIQIQNAKLLQKLFFKRIKCSRPIAFVVDGVNSTSVMQISAANLTLARVITFHAFWLDIKRGNKKTKRLFKCSR